MYQKILSLCLVVQLVTGSAFAGNSGPTSTSMLSRAYSQIKSSRHLQATLVASGAALTYYTKETIADLGMRNQIRSRVLIERVETFTCVWPSKDTSIIRSKTECQRLKTDG